MSSHAELLAQYRNLAPTLADRGAMLSAAIATWLANAGLKVHSVTARVKDAASLERKLARPDRSYHELWDVTDLLGLRVITYFADDVDRVGRLIETHLPIDLTLSIDKRRVEPGRFGYRSLHYAFGLGDDVPDELRLPPRARAEIQIRSILEHAWAEIEHDSGYKAPGAVPEEVRHRLSRLAGLLEIADLEFVAIRDELAAYASALPARIADATSDVALDVLALSAMIRSPEVDLVDRAIADAFERPLGDDLFFPDYLLGMLQHVGISTVSALRSALATHAGSVTAMAPPYFLFAWNTWRLSPASGNRILRGYALFFLAHAHALSGAGLELDKVERLTRLYRALDYPDDPKTAQQIATQLVEVLGSGSARHRLGDDERIRRRPE